MTLIGKILAGRYEILEEVGSGGMAVVYKAKCQLLNRFVAVKVLRPDLQNDEEFVRRFNVEAQAAASLTHPNIVSIYDVGYEDGLHYIVMEYIEGKTLKEYIEERHILPWREAADYAIQIARGLEQAHKNSIIHRDVKPHNIIMTSDGVMKVTDFGIARANVQSTVTCEDSAIGSVHYISPEQARGGYTDERSDIYSLAVVLYEMLTGKVPFDSERPVTVAIMHLQDEPVKPREYNLSIPLALERVVMKAMTKEVSARYRSITEMITEIQNVLNDPSREYFATADSLDGEENLGATKKIPVINAETIAAANFDRKQNAGIDETVRMPVDESGHMAEYDVHADTKKVKASYVKDEAVLNDGRTESEKENADLKKKKKKEAYPIDKKKSRNVVIAAIISAVVVVCGLFFALGSSIGLFDVCSSTNENSPVVPNVVGENYDAIVEEYKNKDVGCKFSFIIHEEKSEEEPGTILRQEPAAGTKVEAGAEIIVDVYVSVNDERITLEDYTKKKKEDAKTDLRNKGLKCEFEEVFSDDIPKYHVVSQDPIGGSKVEKGSSVTLFISKGPDKEADGIEVSDYTGKSDLDAVENSVEGKGLKAVFVEEYSNTVAEGKIIRQVPAAGTVLEEGDKVTFYVSKGPKKESDEPAKPDESDSPSDSPNQDDTPSQEQRKKTTLLTIYGPTDKNSALVQVNVNGNNVFSKTLQKGKSEVIRLESTKSEVEVEILYDGVSKQKKTVRLH